MFAGNAWARHATSLASVYSGHQFGVWAGQLGDGRALLLGEVDAPAGPLETAAQGQRACTPYSRMGDGRAVLRSSIREFLCSEAMHALGIPTTRALCVTGSALPVRRETIETAAVVTRVAPSFIRFGHFEHFAHTAQDVDALRRLADFVIDAATTPNAATRRSPCWRCSSAVTRRTAELMAQWQAVGFCHGVMNTDNMSILGLTIDYGPFGFLDAFDPGHICNHSDHQGRYAYARQPQRRVLEPACAGAGAAAADRRRRARASAAAALEPYKRACSRGACTTRMARQARPGRPRETDDRELIDDLLRLHGHRPHATSRSRSAALGELRRAEAPTTTRARPVHRPRRLRRLGRALRRSACAPRAAIDAERAVRDEPRQPEVRAAQPPGAGGDPSARSRATSARSRAC